MRTIRGNVLPFRRAMSVFSLSLYCILYAFLSQYSCVYFLRFVLYPDGQQSTMRKLKIKGFKMSLCPHYEGTDACLIMLCLLRIFCTESKILTVCFKKISDLILPFLSGNLEISRHAPSARRVVVILSPLCLTGKKEGWTETNFNNFVKQLSTLTTPIFLWCLENPPKVRNLAKCSAYVKPSVPKIEIASCTSGRIRFWYKLRMFLPRPKISSQESVAMNSQPSGVTVDQHNEPALQTSRSQESLDVLV